MKRPMAAAIALLFASAAAPAFAQMDHSAHMPPAEQASAEVQPANPHAGHGASATGAAVPPAVAPPVPTDHAADAFFDPAVMARTRTAVTK